MNVVFDIGAAKEDVQMACRQRGKNTQHRKLVGGCRQDPQGSAIS